MRIEHDCCSWLYRSCIAQPLGLHSHSTMSDALAMAVSCTVYSMNSGGQWHCMVGLLDVSLWRLCGGHGGGVCCREEGDWKLERSCRKLGKSG